MTGYSVYASAPTLSGAPTVPPVVGTGSFTFTSVSAGPFVIPVPPLTGAPSRVVLNISAAIPGAAPNTANISDTTNMPAGFLMVLGSSGNPLQNVAVTLTGTVPGGIAGTIMANALVGPETAILSAIAA